MSVAPHVARRTIRRHQLREIVPLADSTIYDMEQRGEFPRGHEPQAGQVLAGDRIIRLEVARG